MTTTAITPLDRLYTDASAAGWQPHPDQCTAAGRWIRDHDTGRRDELSIVEPDIEYGIAVLTAHTTKGTFRLKLEPPADLDAGLALLRAFLDLPESGDES